VTTAVASRLLDELLPDHDVHDVHSLVTATRVHATDDAARRRFARYWRLIRLGGAAIRRDMRAAIARRAKAYAGGPPAGGQV
jgi:hypothetical protein